ncbi:MAG: alanine--glyoxylate aminotransferase family protein [Myxococcaceae bacterium]|nr:alanine--glyoxylate aminotransferase family protein [Myxococcaceae bacterium]
MAAGAPLKRYLLTAGPTPVPERVSLAMAQPMIFHRSEAFAAVFKEALEGLQWVFRTTQPVICISGSGTAGMEAAVTNFHSPGDKVICLRGGRFGERWAELCQAYGLTVVPVDVEWGRPMDVAALKAVLEQTPDARSVFATASESSTGVAHPIREIAALCSGRDTLCIVDAISALGAFDVPQDEWGIDVLVGSSQKALMLPPGLAFVGVSQKGWARARTAKLPRFYLDLARMLKSQEKNESTWTPAVSLIVGLRESIRMMREEGLEAIFARHRQLAEATRRACMGLGCELFATDAPSPAVTSVRVPGGLDGSKLVQRLRGRWGITISGGQEKLKGKIFRVAHMGYFGPFDIITAVSGLEMVLAELGHTFELGAGVQAAQRVLGSVE